MISGAPEDILDAKGEVIRLNGAKAPIGNLCLSVAEWISRDIPAPDFLLGEILSTTTRAMVTGPTGLGKTNFGLAMAANMSAGLHFLHWAAGRPSRVLYIDGEMSRRLMRWRVKDAARRLGATPENLFVLCRDDAEGMAPLNTEDGQGFVEALIDRLAPLDFIFFDNIQALLLGDMKDEESWAQTLPWAKTLTRRSIGQLWFHHTGHDESRSYGTKTKEWQLDLVGLMKRVEDATTDIAFGLEFTKARERMPQNRADFEPVTVTLAGDAWHVEPAEKRTTGKRPSPKGEAFHSALIDALAAHGSPRPVSANRPSATMEQWKCEALRLGLLNVDAKDNATRAQLSKYRLELVAAGWVACNGEVAWSTR
jgi:hypothetical protein